MFTFSYSQIFIHIDFKPWGRVENVVLHLSSLHILRRCQENSFFFVSVWLLWVSLSGSKACPFHCYLTADRPFDGSVVDVRARMFFLLQPSLIGLFLTRPQSIVHLRLFFTFSESRFDQIHLLLPCFRFVSERQRTFASGSSCIRLVHKPLSVAVHSCRH